LKKYNLLGLDSSNSGRGPVAWNFGYGKEIPGKTKGVGV
jgi:hypothetical protein